MTHDQHPVDPGDGTANARGTSPFVRPFDARSAGERKLFEALVREHSEMLYVFITSSVGRTSIADEVHQETLLIAWRRLSDFDQTRSFGAWLRGIARVQIRAQSRQRSLGVGISDEVLDMLEARFHALSRQVGDQLDDKLECLRACLAGLVDRDQHALEVRYSDGLRGLPLATRLETSVENAKKIVQRARARLLVCMQKKLQWEVT